jgi:hypothetical protein
MNLIVKQMDLIQFENEINLNTKTMKYYCTNRFYTFLAFQRHIICDFWIHGSKFMDFVSLQIF